MTNAQTPQIDDRIIEAALGLISANGLNAVSMTDVASSASVARQTLYNRYPDIDSIVAEVIERHGAESIVQLQSLLDTAHTTARRIGIVVEYALATTAHGNDLATLRGGLSPKARRAVDNYNDQMRTVIEAVVVKGIETKDLQPASDSQTAATIVQAMLDGATHLDKRSTGTADVVTTMILAALGATST